MEYIVIRRGLNVFLYSGVLRGRVKVQLSLSLLQSLLPLFVFCPFLLFLPSYIRILLVHIITIIIASNVLIIIIIITIIILLLLQ